MSSKKLPGVTRVTNAPQGRIAPPVRARGSSIRSKVSKGSGTWLLRNKIGFGLILAGSIGMAIGPGFFFGFVMWCGIILYFQNGDETGMENVKSISQRDYIDTAAINEMSWTSKALYDPAESMYRGVR